MPIQYSYLYFQISYSPSFSKDMSKDSEVGMVTYTDKGKKFFFYPNRSDRLWYAPVPYSLRGSFF
jgi:hypothetical protein